MYLWIRNKLPIVVAASWLFLIWFLLLGSPGLDEMASDALSGAYGERFTWIDIVALLAGLAGAMITVDRLWCSFVRKRVGVDPMTLHWSQLRNRHGRFFCAACQSVFMLPPEDLSDHGWVHCGDCGHAVAPYGEMKPLLRDAYGLPQPRSDSQGA